MFFQNIYEKQYLGRFGMSVDGRGGAHNHSGRVFLVAAGFKKNEGADNKKKKGRFNKNKTGKASKKDQGFSMPWVVFVTPRWGEQILKRVAGALRRKFMGGGRVNWL